MDADQYKCQKVSGCVVLSMIKCGGIFCCCCCYTRKKKWWGKNILKEEFFFFDVVGRVLLYFFCTQVVAFNYDDGISLKICQQCVSLCVFSV